MGEITRKRHLCCLQDLYIAFLRAVALENLTLTTNCANRVTNIFHDSSRSCANPKSVTPFMQSEFRGGLNLRNLRSRPLCYFEISHRIRPECCNGGHATYSSRGRLGGHAEEDKVMFTRPLVLRWIHRLWFGQFSEYSLQGRSETMLLTTSAAKTYP